MIFNHLYLEKQILIVKKKYPISLLRKLEMNQRGREWEFWKSIH